MTTQDQSDAVAGSCGHVQALGGGEVVARGATDLAKHQCAGLQAFFHGPQNVGHFARFNQQDMFGRDPQPGQGVGAGAAKIMRLASRGPDPDDGPYCLLFTQGTGQQTCLETQRRWCVQIIGRAHFMQAGQQVERTF